MKNKEKLIRIIKRKVIKGTPEIQTFIKANLTTEGRLPERIFDKFLFDSISIDLFNTSVLVWIAEALERFDSKICRVKDFFEENEILNAKMYVYPVDNIDNYLTIVDVKKISPFPEQYHGYMSEKQIGILKRNDILKVSTEAQRDSHVVKCGGEEVRLININDERVKEIAEKNKDNEYFIGEIKINVVKGADGLPNINYNPQKRTITLDKDSLIIIVDGNHNSTAFERSLTWYPEKEDYFNEVYVPVTITNETILGCKKIVSQVWNREPVNREQINSMERSDANQIVELIILADFTDPLYSKRIVRTRPEIQRGEGFILFSILSDAIEQFYGEDSIKTMSGKQNLKNWLIEFFNELADVMQDDFANYVAVKKNKWNVLPEAWYIYVGLSGKLKEQKSWQKELRKILNSINWDIKNNPFKDIYAKNKLFDIAKNIIEEVM
jgi:hypothetical protein